MPIGALILGKAASWEICIRWLQARRARSDAPYHDRRAAGLFDLIVHFGFRVHGWAGLWELISWRRLGIRAARRQALRWRRKRSQRGSSRQGGGQQEGQEEQGEQDFTAAVHEDGFFIADLIQRKC